jgi:hypothetical protein
MPALRVRTHPLPLVSPLTALMLACLVLPASGCGNKGTRQPVFPVRGQVLYEGQLTPHALVVFHPVAPQDGNTPLPRGEVAEDGTFTLSTYQPGDGAPAGEYFVTVEWWLSSAWPDLTQADDAPPTNRLPQRYSQAGASGIRVRINEGDNELDPFTLTR